VATVLGLDTRDRRLVGVVGREYRLARFRAMLDAAGATVARADAAFDRNVVDRGAWTPCSSCGARWHAGDLSSDGRCQTCEREQSNHTEFRSVTNS